MDNKLIYAHQKTIYMLQHGPLKDTLNTDMHDLFKLSVQDLKKSFCILVPLVQDKIFKMEDFFSVDPKSQEDFSLQFATLLHAIVLNFKALYPTKDYEWWKHKCVSCIPVILDSTAPTNEDLIH